MKCTKCDKIRSCRTDPFCSVDGSFCFACQEPTLCLTKVRKYLDKYVIDSLDRLEWSGGTYFLTKDIEASDFLFDGPNDRRKRRELNSESRVQQRFQKIQSIYTKLNIVSYGKQFNYCRYVNAFIYTGKYGIRAIKALLEQCYQRAIDIYNEIEAMNRHNRLNMSLGIILSWAVTLRVHELPHFEIDLQRMETEKESFFQLVERIELSEREHERRKTELTVAFESHRFPLKSVDNYPYVNFGEPSIEETCKQMHVIKWLHESTPFCEFVELNKINRGYMHDYIKADPYYNMIYSVCIEARTMVLSLGYMCPPFEYTMN